MNRSFPHHLSDALLPLARQYGAPLLQESHEPMAFSASFEARMDRLLHGKTAQYRSKKVLAFGLVIALLISLFTLTATGAWNNIAHFFVTFFEDTAAISIVENENEPKPLIAINPSYLPEGYQQTSSERFNSTHKTAYAHPDGGYIVINQSPAETMNALYDTLPTTAEIEINGHRGLITNGNPSTLIFSDERYVFHIEATLEESEILAVARSLCSKKP
ncbi:MAG: DUF4367 domain-containing protein [Clostridia bacterium]|nr:DUF4367 domain-containing protein [Clostridia bacterium]